MARTIRLSFAEAGEIYIPVFEDTDEIVTKEEFGPVLESLARFFEQFPDDCVAMSNIAMRAEWARSLAEDLASRPGRMAESGYVYVLESGPFFKIGRAQDLDRRVKQLKIQLPFPVTVAHTVRTNDAIAAELFFHEIFRGKRVNGEWFGLDRIDLEWIKRLERFDV